MRITIAQDGVKALGYLAQHQLFDQVSYLLLKCLHDHENNTSCQLTNLVIILNFWSLCRIDFSFLQLPPSHHIALDSIGFLVLISPHKSIQCLDWTLHKGHLVKRKVWYFGLFDKSEWGQTRSWIFTLHPHPRGIAYNQLFLASSYYLHVSRNLTWKNPQIWRFPLEIRII